MVDQSLHQPAASTSTSPNTPSNPPISESTTPPPTSTAPAAPPTDSIKASDKEEDKPFDQYAPFPYSKAAFCEWFRKSDRHGRNLAPYVLLKGFFAHKQKEGPFKDQYTFKPTRVDPFDAVAPIALAGFGAGIYAFFFCALAGVTGVTPSASAIRPWVRDGLLALVYCLSGGIGLASATAAAVAGLAMVWIAFYSPSCLACSAFSTLPKRVQTAIGGTTSLALVHFLLFRIFGSLPFGATFLSVVYALPTVGVGMDWWLEALLRRVAAGKEGEKEESGGQRAGTCGCSGCGQGMEEKTAR